ncbi:MAG TPA: large conductance mechanosensitive channel protein MscL [Candidatus Paceibacterota bacterium]|nr:large conductance mechanosensitive channel protein MscL [Candidatus Paceibacterota bacterium]
MGTFFSEFKKFALRGNAIDLAVGIVIGAAFTNITTSLVNDIITPPIGLLIGSINFTDLVIALGGDVVIRYGHFVQAVISFLVTAFVLFLIIRFLNRLQHAARREQKAGTTSAASKSPELVVLEEIRDTLKK